MPVKDADPAAIELDAAFAAAMNGPAKPREAAPPPERDIEAPHGRDDDGNPLAPFGWTKAGKDGPSRPRLNSAGRRAKDDAPRTGTPPPADAKGKPKGAADPPPITDFSEPLGELADAVWMGLSGLSLLGPKIPVIGKKLSGEKIAAEGYIWRQNRAHLIKAAQITADHNVAARMRLAKLAEGNATWVLMAGFTLMPFVAQTAAVLQGDDALKEMNPEASVKRLAELNKAEWDEMMESLRAQAAVMAAQAAVMAAQAEADVAMSNGHAPA
jgi:hypothetical protein